jgi:Family of unknown function (DUF6504)
METVPIHFIDEPIQVHFDIPPLLEKTPPCPNGFTWLGQDLRITTLLFEWQDFRRRGRMARNMIPAHTQHAARVGSWGVGRYFFRVQVEDSRIFEIYYDRTPSDAFNRKGKWFLLGERRKSE